MPFSHLTRFPFLAATAVVALALTGCPSTTPPAIEGDDHGDGHDHPTTLVEAHDQLVHMSATIKQAFEAGKPGDAHDALHEIGHVIEAIPELAKKAGLTDEEASTKVSDDLMASFGKLDSVLHSDDVEVKWGDVSETIEAAMAKLASWLPEGASHDDDEEGHHEEDGDGHDGDEDEHEHAEGDDDLHKE